MPTHDRPCTTEGPVRIDPGTPASGKPKTKEFIIPKPLRHVFVSLLWVACLASASLGQTGPGSQPLINVLAQSPVETEADLLVICLFRSTPGNPLKGALTEMDEKTHGLLTDLRQRDRFYGEQGETLLVTLPKSTLKAKSLLLIGLGDSESFTPDRMRLVGTIILRESSRLRADHPYLAPMIKDGGVDRFTTGEIAEQVARGFLEAYATELHLAGRGEAEGPAPEHFTYLAGKAYQASTQGGIDKAIAEARK